MTSDHPHKDEAGLAAAYVVVPAEITMMMRHLVWRQEYLDNGATYAEACILAANREADPEEVEGAKSAYRAMLRDAPLATPPEPDGSGMLEASFRRIEEWLLYEAEPGTPHAVPLLKGVKAFLTRLDDERKGRG